MTRHRSPREYLLGGAFALLALFPVVTGTGQVPVTASVFGEAGDIAIEDREHASMLRRMRRDILRDCSIREGEGEENVCPDVNDYDALKRYWFPTEHSAASAANTAMATLEELTGYQRNVMRRAMRVGQCPPNMDDMVSGFQALCEHVIGQGDTRLDQLVEATRRYIRHPRGQDAPSQDFRLKGLTNE